MNIQEARAALNNVYMNHDEDAYDVLRVFINDVEKLMKNNSIKQTPALFKPFERKE